MRLKTVTHTRNTSRRSQQRSFHFGCRVPQGASTSKRTRKFDHLSKSTVEPTSLQLLLLISPRFLVHTFPGNWPVGETLMRTQRKPIHAVSTWVRRQPPKVKAFLAVVSGMAALVLLRSIVHDHDNLFVAAEAVHSIGILVLIYKLMKENSCAGKVSNFFLGNFVTFWFLFNCW